MRNYWTRLLPLLYPLKMESPIESADFKTLANLLNSNVRENVKITLHHFSEIEATWDGTWIWALGPESSIVAGEESPADIDIFYCLKSPFGDHQVQVFLGDELLREIQFDQADTVVRGSIRIRGKKSWALRFRMNKWNGGETKFAPTDERALGLCFSELKFQLPFSPAPHPELKGKICPIPFARWDVAPCCREWQREELFFESDGPEFFFGSSIADPWNGSAARKLRESILDGSYRFCDLSTCITKHYTLECRQHCRH